MRESQGLPKPEGAMKCEGGACLPRKGKIPCLGAGALPARLYAASSARRSKSAHVGTRKMVNYA